MKPLDPQPMPSPIQQVINVITFTVLMVLSTASVLIGAYQLFQSAFRDVL